MRPSYPVPVWNLTGTRTSTPDAWSEVFDYRYRTVVYFADRVGREPDRLTALERSLCRDWWEALAGDPVGTPHPWTGRPSGFYRFLSDVAKECLAGGTPTAAFRGDCIVWGLLEHAKEGIESTNLSQWLTNVVGDDAGMKWLSRNRQERRVEKMLRRYHPDLYLDGDFNDPARSVPFSGANEALYLS